MFVVGLRKLPFRLALLQLSFQELLTLGRLVIGIDLYVHLAPLSTLDKLVERVIPHCYDGGGLWLAV